MPILGKSPFDDASGQQLLGFLAQNGVQVGITTADSAGTTITDAAPISAGTVVGNGAAASGYILPGGAVFGTKITVLSRTNNIKVYPPDSSSTIDGGGAGVAKAVTAGTPLTFLKASDTHWVSH